MDGGPGSTMPSFEPDAEFGLKNVHPAPQRNEGGPYHQVVVVGHQAPRDHGPPISLLNVTENLDELDRLVGVSDKRNPLDTRL